MSRKMWAVAVALIAVLAMSCPYVAMADEGKPTLLPSNRVVCPGPMPSYEIEISKATDMVDKDELLTAQSGVTVDAAYLREVAAAKAAHKSAWLAAREEYRKSDKRDELARAVADRDFVLAKRRADELYRATLRRAKRNLLPISEDANTPCEKLSQKLKAVARAYENAEAAVTDRLNNILASNKDEVQRNKAREVWMEEVSAAERKLCADTKQICAGADWLANGLNMLAGGYNDKVALALAVYRQMLSLADMVSAPHVRASVEAGASAQCDAMCASGYRSVLGGFLKRRMLKKLDDCEFFCLFNVCLTG